MKFDIRSFMWDKATYYSISDELAKENLRLLRVLSFLAAAAFAVITAIGFIAPSIVGYKLAYIAFMVVCLIIGGISIVIKPEHETAINVLIHVFQFVLLSFGILMGTILSPQNVTVSYLVFLLAVPLLFTSRALYTNLMTLATIILYIISAYFNQEHDMFIVNLLNVILYGSLSLLTTTYFMSVKLQRFVFRSENSRIQSNNYEKTITDMIREAGTEDDAGEILNNLLHFIGENSKADRAYIFEQNSDGGFDNTYEWCCPGILSQKSTLQNLSADYVESTWLSLFRKSRSITISDIKNYRSTNEDIYDFLSSRSVKSVVAAEIKIDDKVIGFYGVDNPPKDSIQYLSELFRLVEFEFAMMIRLRNRTQAIEDGAIHDQLTGCKNRKALDWAYNRKYNPNKSFTIIECDLNGLKAVNDKQGHDAGDRYISGCADTFCEVFGKANVYRMGGDEFAIILTEKTREEVDDLMGECTIKIGERSTMGYVYVDHMDMPFEDLLHQADMEMYRQKDIFYQTRKRYREV